MHKKPLQHPPTWAVIGFRENPFNLILATAIFAGSMTHGAVKMVWMMRLQLLMKSSWICKKFLGTMLLTITSRIEQMI